MAITNYSELKTAVANWLGRDDLTSRIPEFISGAESRIFSDVLIPAFMKEATVTLSSGDSDIDLPSDYWELMDAPVLVDSDNNKYPLSVVPYGDIYMNLDPDSDGQPTKCALLGSKMYFDYKADEDYTIHITYYYLDTLSDSSTTNWLITNFPMLLLYASLIEASVYTEDDSRIWITMYDEQKRRLQRHINRFKIANWTIKHTRTKLV